MQQVVDALLGILSIDKDVRTAASDFLTQVRKSEISMSELVEEVDWPLERRGSE